MYQISNDYFKVPDSIFNLKLKPTEGMVLVYFLSFRKRRFIYPSRATIAKNCGIKSLKTVDKVVKSLVTKGLLTYTKGYTNCSNSYVLHIPGVSKVNSNNEPVSDEIVKQEYKSFQKQERRNKRILKEVLERNKEPSNDEST